ncbi:RING finger protein 151-like [Haliotis rufescens]|uniref:RING finger protein 151-like n=1 Tax=Haliotis rufescens TaxID=6454 RepID=UPI001EB039C6|nr:RING finger protein 151-like [Haliotis rufescens]
MGYSINKFVCAVDPNLICGICGCVLQDAVLTPCGHTFCCLCLDTWLARPGTETCPECRTHVGDDGGSPVHSLRNLINGFEVECDHAERGCKVVLKLDRLKSHLDTCAYFPVECAGCEEVVNRFELASHQIQCVGIAASVEEGAVDTTWSDRRRRRRATEAINNAEITELLCRISSLEMQVAKFKRDIELANAKNRMIEKEYIKVKEELNCTRHEVVELQSSDYDPKYDYGHTPQSMARLSLLIAKFLLRRPRHIDSDFIFSAVKKCYEQYFRCNSDFEHDVHMLLATAFASNWFTPSQRLSLGCWLQCIARYRHDTRDSTRYSPVIMVR